MNNFRYLSLFLSFFILLDPVLLQSLIPEKLSKSGSKKATHLQRVDFILFQSPSNTQLLNRAENSTGSYDQWEALTSRIKRLPKQLSGGVYSFISFPYLLQSTCQNLKRGPPSTPLF